MLNERIIRDYSLSVYMNSLDKTINSKAIFNQRDLRTAALVVQLLDNKKNKKPIDLTGTTVVAKILKNDDTKSTIYCTILEPELGTVAIGFTEQTLLTIGVNMFEFEIQAGHQILYSPKISYTVVDNLFDEDDLLPSQDEFPVLNTLIYNVQLLEQELLSLDSLVKESEQLRNSNEEQRKGNEVKRNEEFEGIKELINAKVSLINQRMQDLSDLMEESENKIDEEIIKINGSVDLKISEVNAKIVEVNSKISEIDNRMSQAEKNVTQNIQKINTTISENIAKVDAKIQEVNALITSIRSTFDKKIAEIDDKIAEFDSDVAKAISKVQTDTSKLSSDLTSSVNTKIGEMQSKTNQMETKVNNQISLMDSKVNTHVGLITDKISESNEKIVIVETLNSQINSAEQTRNENEVRRNNTVQSIVEALEVTQSDIDDILSMIGGL